MFDQSPAPTAVLLQFPHVAEDLATYLRLAHQRPDPNHRWTLSILFETVFRALGFLHSQKQCHGNMQVLPDARIIPAAVAEVLVVVVFLVCFCVLLSSLSRGIRVFTAAQCVDSSPVGGAARHG